MSATMTLQRNTSGLTASAVRSSQDITADGVTVFDGSIAASQTDVLLGVVIDISQLKGLFMLAVGGDVVLQTNDGTAPDDTITLKDGVALVWDATSGYFANPFSVDVDEIYATTGSGDSRTLQIIALVDATP